MIHTENRSDDLFFFISFLMIYWIKEEFVLKKVKLIGLVCMIFAVAMMANTASASIASVAYQWIGVPYRYGGNSRNGVDCSHLVYQVYQGAGEYWYPYMTVAQLQCCPYFTFVSANKAKSGDLVLFFGLDHVGIYIGNGYMIDANSFYGEVMIDNLNSSYWKQLFPYFMKPKR